MGDWPLGDHEHDQIVRHFKRRCAVHRARPLTEYIRRHGLDWHEIAPNTHFNNAVVHLWSTGARIPNRGHIDAIKRLNGLSDADVPIPDNLAVVGEAEAETITWIRDQWFAPPGETGKVISRVLVKVLDLVISLRFKQLQREPGVDVIEILQAIRDKFPEAEVWILNDLKQLKEDWLSSHAGFHDAIERDLEEP